MTIIVFRDGIMAADTSVWQDYILIGSTQKILRLASGALVGCAGDEGLATAFRAWAAGGFVLEKQPVPVGQEEFRAIVAYPDGRTDTYGGTMRPVHSRCQFLVAGSCHEFANGCLAAGASAARTVRLAINHYAWAAGNIQIEKIIPMAKKAHPGFQKAAQGIAAREGVSGKAAAAILASATRKAPSAAKKANPRLKRVK